MCNNNYCPIGYGDFDCEHYREGGCQYNEEDEEE